MDRRDFFKSLFLTPLFTPMILASKTSNSDAELYLISNSPQHHLPLLLKQLKSMGLISGNSYTFHNPVEQQGALTSALISAGWTPAGSGERAHMSLTSSRLFHPATPSFTLTQEGRIWDLRTRRLHALWREMNFQAPSNQLTSVSFHTKPEALILGKTVSLHQGGKKVKTLSLTKNTTHLVQTRLGQITVCFKDGTARVEDSSCRHKICVHCPPAAYSGERIICAPNQFMLSIDGPSSVDTIIG